MSAEEHRSLFLQRWEGMKAAALTHPWAQWVAVIDPGIAPACRALNGKAWKVDGSELAAVIREHLDAQHPNCRCRLAPKRKAK